MRNRGHFVPLLLRNRRKPGRSMFVGPVASLRRARIRLLPPPNTPPTITSLIPDQSGSGTEPIEIDLASYGSDEEDDPQDLVWRAEGFDPELIGVREKGTEGGALSFTPTATSIFVHYHTGRDPR